MPIRITGLNSGLDTDSIVQELVSAYRTKQEKYEKAQTKLSWTQESWKEMNTKIYGFYSKSLSNMRWEGNFTSKKTTTVSDSTKATVTASSSVINGTQTLKVKQLATAGYLTGKELKSLSGTDLTTSSTLSELGVENGTLKLNVGGTQKYVNVSAGMTISDFVSALKEQGVSANFDAKQQRFFVNSSSSGADNDFNFITDNEEDMVALKKLGLLSAQNVIDVAADTSVQDSIKYKAVDMAITDGKITGITIKQYESMSDEEKNDVYAQLSDEDWTKYTEDAKVELVKEFDKDNLVSTSGVDYTDASYIAERLQKLGEYYYDALMESKYDNIKGDYAVKADASNAIIELNGAEFESDTNEFSVNGLSITATGVSDLMTITTSTDVDGIYNMIKDFFKEYNTLMNSMETAYNAASAKDYEPLTDDEKSEMSEEEVEKWEKKIKDSLLRRDDTLSSLISSISMKMTNTYEIDGKTYSLSSFGISTTAYFSRVENESYAYHIDGDEDDASTQGNEDKLRKAIQEDPETVTKFFTQLAKDVYAGLNEKMEATTLSSAFTVYNDKQLQSEYDEYTETIEKWEEKLKDLEDYYYDKFAAMETALATLQSQTNSLTSLLGG